MSRIVRIKNNTGSSGTWVGQTILSQEYFTIPDQYIERWETDTQVFSDVAQGNLIINNNEHDFINPIEGWEYLEGEMSDVETVGELVVNWSSLKSFYAANLGSFMNYVDLGTYYYVWLCYRNQKMYIPSLLKETDDCDDFETNFKSLCNIPQAPEMRLSTCRYGRRLHSRYITFFTAEPDGFDNTNYLEEDHGDSTYTMVDADRNVTTNKSLCKETWIDWEPLYSFEVVGGAIFIPSSLAGNDDDGWELHVVAAPDYPKEYGGSLQFISNPRLKWRKGGWLEEDQSMNPAETSYVPTYHFTKIRWILKHPLGASSEFQIHMKIFR